MADTSRIRPWTAPVTAIAAALSLAACSSSDSGGGSEPTGPTEPLEIALAAEETAQAAQERGQGVVDEARRGAHALDVDGGELDHQYDASLTHLHATGGDSGAAMQQAQAVLDAVDAEDVEDNAQAVIDGIKVQIAELRSLRQELDAMAEAAAARGDDAEARRLAFDADLYDDSMGVLRQRLAEARATKAQADAEAAEVETFGPDTLRRTLQYGGADVTVGNPNAAKGVDLIGTMTGLVVHEAIIAGNDGGQKGTIAASAPVIPYPARVSREWDTSTGFTARSFFEPHFETVTDETGADIQALSLAGRPAASLGNPRFVPSDDDTAARLNADGTGWIMADGTDVPFDPGVAVPGDAYYEGLLLGGGGDVFCLGACSVSDGVLQGEWWGKFDEAAGGGRTAETRYRKATAEELLAADAPAAREYVPVTTMFLQYGFWLNGTSHVASYVREWNATSAFNLAAADLGNDSDLDDETSATYSGHAAGMSVRVEGELGDADPDASGSMLLGDLVVHSGRFLADAELTATFAGAATALEGTISNFRADGNPLAVNTEWEVTLSSHELGAAGDSTRSGTGTGGTTMSGDPTTGEWSGEVYGSDAAARPAGVYGVFDAVFTDGKAYGLFHAPYDPLAE